MHHDTLFKYFILFIYYRLQFYAYFINDVKKYILKVFDVAFFPPEGFLNYKISLHLAF